MGRPRKQNPKGKLIGIRTTEEKYRRYKSLGLVGDEAIDILLFHLENGDRMLNIQKSQAIINIRNMKKRIEELEYEVLKEETKLSELNEKIGVAETGISKDVDRCISNVLQRYNRQEIYTLDEFLELKSNKYFLENQAELCHLEVNKFKELVKESQGGE